VNRLIFVSRVSIILFVLYFMRLHYDIGLVCNNYRAQSRVCEHKFSFSSESSAIARIISDA